MSSKKEEPKRKRKSAFAGSSGKILPPRSNVWQFFELNRTTRRAQCRFCEKILAYTGGTTNLRYHLTAAHDMAEFEVIGPSAKVFKDGKTPKKDRKSLPKQKSRGTSALLKSAQSPAQSPAQSSRSFTATKDLDESLPSDAPSDANESPSEHLAQRQSKVSEFFKPRRSTLKSPDESQGGVVNEKILQMVIKDLQPLEFVTSEGFVGLMRYLQPSYQVPKIDQLLNRILSMHEECQVKLRETLSEEVSHCSIAYDVWKGSNQETYATIAIHYLTSNWERKCFVLGTSRIVQSKNVGGEITSLIRCLLFEYGLDPDKVVAVVNRQGFVKGKVDQVGQALGCESMSCAAEKLEQCVQNAFAITEVKALIEQVGKITSYLLNDETAIGVMEEIRNDASLPPADLVEPRNGSWVTKSDMVIKFVALRQVVEKVSEFGFKGSDMNLSLDQWELAEHLVNSLQILRAALAVLSKASGSVSCLLPVVHSILQHCEDVGHLHNSPMDKFLKTIGKEVREKWDLTAILPSSIPMLGALLDPRFKKLKFIAEEDKVDVFDALKGVITSSTDADSAAEPSGLNSSGDVAPFLCLFGSGEDYGQDKQDVDSEIANYISFPPLRHDSCPLDWWRVNKGRFPKLSIFARQFLSVPAVTQPIEDVTSGISRIDIKRTLLEETVAGPIIFLNKNISLLQT